MFDNAVLQDPHRNRRAFTAAASFAAQAALAALLAIAPIVWPWVLPKPAIHNNNRAPAPRVRAAGKDPGGQTARAARLHARIPSRVSTAGACARSPANQC